MTIRKRTPLVLLAAALAFRLPLATPEAAARQDPLPGSVTATNPTPAQAESDEGTTNQTGTSSSRRGGYDRGPLVVVGHDVVLKAGDTAEAVVVIGGSAKIHGKVRDAAVVIFGDLEVDGEVADAAVAVLGNIKVGPTARIHGDVVAVGGTADVADGATIGKEPVAIDFPDWIKKWFLHCFLKMRPLAPQVGWVWVIAGITFLLYLLIAAAFPRPVGACLNELTRRPATTFLMGLLAKLLLPVILLILAATGVGLIVTPFAIAAVVLGAIVGKVALLEWLGLKVGQHFGTDGLQNRLVAFVLGSVIITLLYLVPVLGMLTFAITSVWGLGCAATASFGSLRKELPEKPAAPAGGAGLPGMGGVGQGTSTVVGAPAGSLAFGAAGETGFAGTGNPESATATMAMPPPVMPEILTFPKAGFWERMAAGFLDLVLVGILGGLIHVPPLGLLVALAYFAGMWTWKGTTIGGIVLGLKVVRTDGQPVTFAAALVRALAGAFSMVVLFLGFLWIAWDAEKQGWHDRIAGTVVLRLPRGTPLVVL
jgi:uncharacterized RDD family membrane protein YckC